MNKILFVLFLSVMSFDVFSQTAESIANQANSMGIITQEDVLNELKKRGMTIKDAEKMALMYGIDYSDFISEYIIGSSASIIDIPLPTVSEIIIQEDTLFKDIEVEDSLPENIIETSLNYFGYDIFLNNPFANKDYLLGNIDEGYILSPGDVLRIYVFGDNTYQAEVTIDLNGNILLPEIGMFFASGHTFSSISSRLNNFLGRSFSGLIDSPKRSFLDVSLTQLRPVKVTILGEINTPGPHLVGGFATVLNALYSSGGIKVTGSLRNIQVYRKNKLIKSIDLYDYITKGSLDGDIRLTNNDIIFVPIRENSIHLYGSVKNSLIYELKTGEGINDLLDYSGGLNPDASSLAVINRIKPISQRLSEDVYSRYLTSFDITKSYTSLKDTYKVKRGEYLYLIAKKFDVKVDEIKKWNNLKTNHLSIGQILEIYHNDFELIDGDIVNFNTIPDKILNSVMIYGNVNQPGYYPLDNYSDLRLLIVNAANNIKPNTYLGKVDVSKINIDGSRSFNSYNLEKILNGSVKVALEDSDQVRIYSMEEVEGEGIMNISLLGYGIEDTIKHSWMENYNIYDFIFSYVPFDDPDYMSNFLRTRVDLKRYNKELGVYNIIPLDIDNDRDFKLKPKDEVVLYSRDISENIQPKFQISGFVINPGEYRLDSAMVIEDAILSAGGLAEFADINRVGVYSIDFESKLRSSQLNYFSLDMDYLKGISKESKNSSFIIKSFDNISIYKDPNIKDPVTVTVIGEVNSPGSVTLENINESVSQVISKVGGFTSNASLGSSYIIRDTIPIDYNFIDDININKAFLSNNDTIVVVSSKEEITVSGAVYNPTKILYSNQKANYYLKNAGGKNRKLAGKAFVIYPSGKAKKIKSNTKIYPGSEIFVSFKEEKEKKNFSEQFMNIFSVMTGALTTIVLAKQLL